MEILKQSITTLKGVGSVRSKHFMRMGIFSIEDLLFTFPRDYEDRRSIKKLSETTHEENACFYVTVTGKATMKSARKGLKIYSVPIADDSTPGYAIFYNAPFILKTFHIGAKLFLKGKVKINYGTIQILHPDYEFESKGSPSFNKIVPIYRLTSGLSQKDFINLQSEIIDKYSQLIEEYLPEETLIRNRLCSIPFALEKIHFPNDMKNQKIAKYRLVFEELLLLQLALFIVKSNTIHEKKGIVFKKSTLIDDFIQSLPFHLTNAQMKVFKEIERDMESDQIMNRLIQGDVGSGKTIVAILALYKAVLSGYQGALMAPTEILAEQHFQTVKALLEPLGIKTAFLSGSISKKEKKEIIHLISDGTVDIIIGTHALIEEKVLFRNLGLVITDEQHRFGVRQRSILSNKGTNPDVLVMSATPIPRTLALILYGDLDISIIDELPPGRKKIKTYGVDEKKRKKVYDFVIQQIDQGRQAYIVCPLIEESESIQAQSANSVYEELKNQYLKQYKVGLLHGKMKAHEKDLIMKQFKDGILDVLVSTTVIEVGINVPNATMMIIENCERFGLAQLHQLRGRVGRGEHQSYCILINYANNKMSIERMNVMEKTDNGFVISEKDLELRGPGDFFGTKQHGIPELKIANLFKHIKILKEAQKEACMLLEEDRFLTLEKNKPLKDVLYKKYHNFFEDIGL
ncbi:MAG: ATP-dependent DNA helicase RecG [Bacillota bacterium]